VFSLFADLVCTKCGRVYERDIRFGVCAVEGCGAPLFARYGDRPLDRDTATDRPRTIWRWHEMMPVEKSENVVSLGEGGTPLLRAERLGGTRNFSDLWIKDESGNPTGSFKARGLSAALSKALELGYRRIAVPSAGNAGGAAAAYAARAAIGCDVFLPEDTPALFRVECERYGARVTLVPGLIDACGRLVAQGAAQGTWHDVSTLKEPYRVEGKKTLGYELAEDLAWTLPDVVVYPTGGGTGLIGMWKAFDEMERLGWIGSKRPRMIAVQAAGCAPIPKAFAEGKAVAEKWENAQTYASGLRVPRPFADFLILAILRESGGDAVTVTDAQMRAAEYEIGASEGMFVCPEGAATWAAAKKLAEDGRLDPDSRVVLFNTGTGFKYWGQR
jgi:threonine synthase